jgi:hypothetical protein
MRNKDDNIQVHSSSIQVIISAYQTYPTAEGCESGGISLNKKDCYLLPNGTLGEVVEWNQKYTTKGSVFAQMDMFDQSKVKIISGPATGKTLYVAHAYMTLK